MLAIIGNHAGIVGHSWQYRSKRPGRGRGGQVGGGGRVVEGLLIISLLLEGILGCIHT